MTSQKHTTKQVAESRLKSGDTTIGLETFTTSFDTDGWILEWGSGSSEVNFTITKTDGDAGSSSISYYLVVFLYADWAL